MIYKMLPAWSVVLQTTILVCSAVLIWPLMRMWLVARKLPGPSALPLVGNGLSFFSGLEEMFNMVAQLFIDHGPVVRLWLGPKLVVAISSADDAQLILSHPKSINRDYHTNLAVNGLIHNGLLSSTDDTWRSHRKMMAPAFHFKILETYKEVFNRNADELCARLVDVADGRTVNIKDALSLCTLSAIIDTAIGGNQAFYTMKNLLEVRDMLEVGVTLLSNRLTKPWLLIDWIYALTADGKKRNIMNNVGIKLIDSALALHEDMLREKNDSSKQKDALVIGVGNKKVQNLLSVLFDPNNPDRLTAEQFREEVKTLAIAGMDTTANTMAYVLILLGMHPEYQKKVFQEQQDIFQGSLRAATTEEVAKMTTLEDVIKETLRLFPPALFSPREIPEDLPISNGFVLPAGCSAFICNYNLHRNSANFVDPERFWPERWTPENSVGRHPYAYLPFSRGARSCIAQKYAQLQMKGVLSRVLRQFRFTSRYSMQDLARIEFAATLVSVLGYDVQIYSRLK